MIIAELRFLANADSSASAAEEAIFLLLGALRMNGQILGKEFPLAKTSDGYLTQVMLPAADALDRSHWNTYVAQRMEDLHKADLAAPSVTYVGPEPTACEPCRCEIRTALVLFTTYVCLESPLRCLQCFLPIPLYEMPPTRSEEYSDIISWQSNYQACDTLQMNCSVGERFGTRQLSTFDSALTKEGREICARIDANRGQPAYYYLCRGSGRSVEAETARRCPSCGARWLRAEALHGKFDFQCDKCHLLSNVAWSVRP